MLYLFHVALFSSCIFPCCILFLLHNFDFVFFRVALFLWIVPFHVALFYAVSFPCCTLFILDNLDFVFFSCGTLFIYCTISCCTYIRCNVFVLHSSSVALLPCCDFFLLRFVHVTLFPEVYPETPQTSKPLNVFTLDVRNGPGYASSISMLHFFQKHSSRGIL